MGFYEHFYYRPQQFLYFFPLAHVRPLLVLSVLYDTICTMCFPSVFKVWTRLILCDIICTICTMCSPVFANKLQTMFAFVPHYHYNTSLTFNNNLFI